MSAAPIENYILDYVDRDQQLFKKYNLDVPPFLLPKSGVQGEQLMSAGSLDGQVQDILLTMATYAHAQPGTRPVLVGMRVPESTYSIVVKKGTWPAESASFQEKMQALKGKTVGVTAIGAGADQQLTLALSQAGMTRKDITPLAVGQVAAGGIAQMKAGRIDAYVGITWATSRVLIKETGGQFLVEFSDPSVPAALSKQRVQASIAREDFAKDHQDVIQSWLKAQTDAKEWVIANPDKAAELVNKSFLGGKFADIATDFIKHFTTDLAPEFRPNFKIEKTDIDTMIGVGQQIGTLKPGQVTYEAIVPAYARA